MESTTSSGHPTGSTRFFEMTRTARRVLVVDLGVLGDAIHLLPALWELRRNYPQAELHVVCSPVGAEIYRLAGCATQLWSLDQSPSRRRVGEQIRTLQALRRLRFDVAITFGDSDRNAIYTGLSGARWRLGQRRSRWHFWSGWCLPFWLRIEPGELPAYERRREILRLAGFPLAGPRFGIQLPREDENWARQHIPEGAIHFSLSASNHFKEWPLDSWIELARLWLARSETLRIVATAGPQPREVERLKTFTHALRDPRILALQHLSVARFAAVLQRCSLHVGGDSGAMHLASALGTRTLLLGREYPNYEAWLPRGEGHGHLIVRCPCATLKHKPCATRPVATCLAEIPPEKALGRALDLLAAPAPAPH